MRFNPRSLKCYTAHARAVWAALTAWALRMGKPRAGEKPSVVMIGNHSLSGNLQAFYEYARDADDLPYRVKYATIDRDEYHTLAKTYDPRDLLLATRLADMAEVMRASCIMASHGPGIFMLLHKLRPRLHFIDVGHGMGFKGFFPRHFKSMRFYTATFLSSQHVLGIYRDLYEWRPEQLLVTGYARMDRLQRIDEIAAGVRRQLDLGGARHTILYAPTWRVKGDVGEIPFAMEADDFLGRLNRLCERIDATLIFRTHANSSLSAELGGYSRIRNVSQKIYPETNDLLTAMDLVITDWSTIAPDFAALDRPVVFLDTPMPPPYDQVPPPIPRGGDLAASIDDLLAAIEKRLTGPAPSITDSQRRMKEAFHGNTLDGHTAQRYDQALRRLVFDTPGE